MKFSLSFHEVFTKVKIEKRIVKTFVKIHENSRKAVTSMFNIVEPMQPHFYD